MIEVGSLLRNRFNDSLWLALDEIAESVLIVNQKTNFKMWAEKTHFEVIGGKFGLCKEAMRVICSHLFT